MFRHAEEMMLDVMMRVVVESTLASVAGWLAALLLGIALSTVFRRAADYLVISPTFLIPILTGAALAWALRRKGKETSYFAVIPSTMFFAIGYSGLARSPFQLHSPWVYLLGIGCGGEECWDQLVFAVPLASCFGYSLASLFLGGKKKLP
jgi:cyanate permease